MVDNDFDSRLEKSYEDEKIIDEIQSWEDLSELERRIIRQVGTYLHFQFSTNYDITIRTNSYLKIHFKYVIKARVYFFHEKCKFFRWSIILVIITYQKTGG